VRVGLLKSPFTAVKYAYLFCVKLHIPRFYRSALVGADERVAQHTYGGYRCSGMSFDSVDRFRCGGVPCSSCSRPLTLHRRVLGQHFAHIPQLYGAVNATCEGILFVGPNNTANHCSFVA